MVFGRVCDKRVADLVFDPTLACCPLCLWRVSALKEPAGLTPKKRPCSSIPLVGTHRFKEAMLPGTSIYVDSFGPLYHELELRIQLATTDRARHATHAKNRKNGGWSLTSYLRN